jgi:hypothetical protein
MVCWYALQELEMYTAISLANTSPHWKARGMQPHIPLPSFRECSFFSFLFTSVWEDLVSLSWVLQVILAFILSCCSLIRFRISNSLSMLQYFWLMFVAPWVLESSPFLMLSLVVDSCLSFLVTRRCFVLAGCLTGSEILSVLLFVVCSSLWLIAAQLAV